MQFLGLIRVGVMQIDIIYHQKDIGIRSGPGRGPKRGPWDHIWYHFLKVEVFNDLILCHQKNFFRLVSMIFYHLSFFGSACNLT